jgi:hypothetical protein
MTEENSPQAEVVYLDSPKLFKAIPLEYPFTFNGRPVREIRLKRLTAKEVADFQDGLKDLPSDAAVTWPVYRDAEGAPLEEGVLDALMDDDRLEVEKALRDFLPRRFQGALAGASAPTSGEATASS